LHVAVADAGPLIHLAQINKLQLLQELFEHVTITASVKREAVDEGVRLGYADAEIIANALCDGWIVVESVPNRLTKTVEKLAEGENISQADAETLLLAKEKRADLLVDEKIVAKPSEDVRAQSLGNMDTAAGEPKQRLNRSG